MKTLRNTIAVLLGLLVPFQAGIAQQMTQDVEVVIMPAGETLLRWFANDNRTYFIQASDPNDHLSTWIWSSLIESGNNQEISYEVGSTADMGFFRLHYTDALPPSGVTLEDWDADGDSLSNALELSLQGNPLHSDSSGDGIPDGWANAHGLSLSANSASGLFQGGPATNLQAYQQGVQAVPGATLQNKDGDDFENDLDAVPDDEHINWPKTPETRYVWIEQITRGGAKAVSKHGHILFPKSNVGSPSAPNPVEVLWDSNISDWVELTGASSWENSGFVSGNTPDVFNAEWSDIDDMNDEGVVVGRSKTIGPYDPYGWVLANAIMRWKMSGTATHQYAPPIYIVPGFDYVAPYGDLKEILVEGTPRIADDGTVSAVSTFLEAGNILPADAQWVASAAQLTDHSNVMAQWKLFDMTTYWQDEFHPGAVIGATGGLLVENQSSIPKTILHYCNGAAAESLEGLRLSNNQLLSTAYAITDTDISKTPSPTGRIWFSVNHAGGDAVFLEKRLGGSGVSRWHNPPRMGEGATRLNARGEAITSTKVWRNGIYTPINDLVSNVNITKLIDLASNGIILAESTSGGVTKTGLLVPVEVSWKAVDGFDNVDDHVDPWNKPIYGKRIFPDFKNPDDTEIRHKLEIIVKTSPALYGKTVYVKSFDVDDSTSEDFDLDESGTTPVIDTNSKAGNDNVTDYLNTPQNGQFWNGSAWGGQTEQGTVDANGETKFIFRVGMQPGSNYRVVASVIDETMYADVQTSNPAVAKYLGSEASQNGGAAASPLLTVWRRLWVENDSMEAIPTDEFGYKRNDLKSEVEIAGITDAFLETGQNDTWLVVPPLKDHSSFIDLSLLTKGRIIFQSESHSILGTANYGGISGTYHIKIEGNHTSVPLGSGFRIYDDDDYGLESPTLPKTNLVNEQMKNYFKPSFLEVIDSSSYNSPNLIPFKPNEDISVLNPSTTVDDVMDLQDKNSCWVCPMTAAYQGLMDEDQDGEEGSTLGETAPHGSYGSGGYYDHSTVFIETCRETYGELLKSSNQVVIDKARSSLSRWIIAVVSHEMGHHPGNQDDDHPEGALMSASMQEVSTFTPETSKFAPSTVKRFRTCERWSK